MIEPNASYAAETALLPTLGWLHTNGRWIEESNGTIITLAGVAWEELAYKTTLDQDPAVRADQMKAMGVNSVRLALNSALWASSSSYPALVDKIIQLLAQRGIYTILDFHCGTSNQAEWTDDTKAALMASPAAWVNWWRVIATRYENQSAAPIYGLFNEPPYPTATYSQTQLDQMWRNAAVQAIQAIHSINPKVVILVDGIRYAENVVAEFYDNPLPAVNIVYALHRYYHYDIGYETYAISYAAGNIGIARTQMEDFYQSVLFQMMNKGYPVMLEEFFSLTSDPYWNAQLHDLYLILRKYQVGFNQWMWESFDFGLANSTWIGQFFNETVLATASNSVFQSSTTATSGLVVPGNLTASDGFEMPLVIVPLYLEIGIAIGLGLALAVPAVARNARSRRLNGDRGGQTSRRIVIALARTVFLFGLVTWGYVVAMQLRDLASVYDVLALWMPIRMDYLGETAFIVSIIAYFLLKFWETKK
jgi:hypothetical protein